MFNPTPATVDLGASTYTNKPIAATQIVSFTKGTTTTSGGDEMPTVEVQTNLDAYGQPILTIWMYNNEGERDADFDALEAAMDGLTPSGEGASLAEQEAQTALLAELPTKGGVDAGNSSSATLANGATFTGVGLDVSAHASVVVAAKSDKSGILYIEFSPDNTNWDSSLQFEVAAGINEVHRISITRRYFRVRFTNNSGAAQTYFRLQSIYGSQQSLTSALNSTVQSDADAITSRSVLMGQTDGGQWTYVPVTPEGHMEVAIHSPRLPFGSLHTESLTPIFQADAVYGISAGQTNTAIQGTGAATTANSSFIVSTGTTASSYAILESLKRLRYRAGQGIVERFTALFSAPASNAYQLIGIAHGEDGVYIGYAEEAGAAPEFGVFYENRGVRETRTLTITVGSTASGNVTVTLDGVAFTVAVSAGSNIQRTVWDIARGTYTGWSAHAVGATVVFVRTWAGAANGVYSLSALTAVGTFAQTKAGVATTKIFIPQSQWNGDKLDGTNTATNPSGFLIDPAKGNVFQIGMQYLGYGAITFQVEVASSDINNPEFVTFHTLKLPNTLTATSFGNPSFPFRMLVASLGSTTNVSVQCGSFAGFIEGKKLLHGPRLTYDGNATANNTSYTPASTIANPLYYNGRANQAVVNLLSISFAQQHNQVTGIFLIKNGTLAGNPNFSSYSTQSVMLRDIAATAVTFSDNAQLVWSGQVGGTGNDIHTFSDEITLQPGEWLSVCARTHSGTPNVSITLNTREDQ